MTMQSVTDPWNERLRLIRFRVNNEKVRFRDELRLVPGSLVVIAAVLYAIAAIVTIVVNESGFDNHGVPWPAGQPALTRILADIGIVTAIAVPAACILFLTGYVYRDAKRRGMHAALWTFLVILLLPAWVAVGFVIYFLVRDPLPYQCPQCGSTVLAKFNYCPACMYNLHPACPRCNHAVRATDRYCPYCAADLAAQPVMPIP